MADSRRSFAELLADVPRLLGDLVRAEIDALKAEFARSARAAAIGVGLIVGAIVVLLFAIGAFIWAAVAALALVLPLWAAALIVGGALLLGAVILAWVGITSLRNSSPNIDARVESINDDIRAIKGELPRATTAPGATSPGAGAPRAGAPGGETRTG